jgi:hypothetical protein
MEQTNILLQSLIQDNQTNDFVATSWDRTVQRLTIAALTVPTDAGGLQIQLLIDSVAQTGTYTLPQSTAKKAFTLATALLVAAEETLTVKVLANGGAADATIWIESLASAIGAEDTWYAPTATDIQGSLSAPEYEQFTNSLLKGTQADPVPGIINDTVAEFRDAIRTGRVNNLGPAGTIPTGLAHSFAHIGVWHLLTRLKSLNQFAERAEKAKDEAEKIIQSVREGKLVFPEPTEIGETVTSSAMGYMDTSLVASL